MKKLYFLLITILLFGYTSSFAQSLASSGTLDSFAYAEGLGPSGILSISVIGETLSGDLTVAAPTNFEISTDKVAYSSSVVLTPEADGTMYVAVFVRLVEGLTQGTYTGDVSAVTTGAATLTIPASGIVYPAQTNSLTLIGVYDGPNTTCRGVEVMALKDIADLSVYGISSVNDPTIGSSDGYIEYTFPAVALAAGENLFIAANSDSFSAFFGFAPDYTSSTAFGNINGDDAIELYENGSIADVFGDVNADGTGTAWEYLKGWAHRVSGTGPDGTTFVLANWEFSGINALRNKATNSVATPPYPLDTYFLKTETFGKNINDLAIYPNPLAGNSFSILSSSNSKMSVQIYDMQGRILPSRITADNSVDVSNLKSGVYMVKITDSNGKSTTKKLIKK